MQFDFIEHKLVIETSGGDIRELKLEPQSVAEFYRKFMAALHELGIDVHIYTTPVEFPNPIRFEEDVTHAAYDADAVSRFWRILQWSDAVFKEFRARFIGKASPVHFFWGSFDLAVTRFSGRVAPPRPGADPGHRRSLFARSEQRGLLAGRKRRGWSRLLRLCRARACGICGVQSATRRQRSIILNCTSSC